MSPDVIVFDMCIMHQHVLTLVSIKSVAEHHFVGTQYNYVVSIAGCFIDV